MMSTVVSIVDEESTREELDLLDQVPTRQIQFSVSARPQASAARPNSGRGKKKWESIECGRCFRLRSCRGLYRSLCGSSGKIENVMSCLCSLATSTMHLMLAPLARTFYLSTSGTWSRGKGSPYLTTTPLQNHQCVPARIRPARPIQKRARSPHSEISRLPLVLRRSTQAGSCNSPKAQYSVSRGKGTPLDMKVVPTFLLESL